MKIRQDRGAVPQRVAPKLLSVPFLTASMAVISAHLEAVPTKPQSLVWEVFEADSHEPVRFGLCLAKPEGCADVRVAVVGLQAGKRYRFRFDAGGDNAPFGEFQTEAAELHDAGTLAA
jgi:phosphodiesterase/alkaline phosphatase D-like protein